MIARPSVQRGKTVGQLIDESLEFYGIKSRQDARTLARAARKRAALEPAAALELAQQEVRAARKT